MAAEVPKMCPHISQPCSLTYEVNAIGEQPVQTFERQEKGKETNELGVELVSENCHGKKRFRKRNPGPLIQPLCWKRRESARARGHNRGAGGEYRCHGLASRSMSRAAPKNIRRMTLMALQKSMAKKE